MWFRRDLRSYDHAALDAALKNHAQVYCAFVFDTEILDPLPTRRDRRVEFIWHSLLELDRALAELGTREGGPGGRLIVRHGPARDEIVRLAVELGVGGVYCNRDYEPQALERDHEVAARLSAAGVEFLDFKDQVVFERREVLTQDGQAFSVFTPYKNAWLKKLDAADLLPHPVERHAKHLARPAFESHIPSLEQIGFEPTNLSELKIPCGMAGAQALFQDFIERIDHYKQRRDFPARKGPSYLSVHLRFGTVSVRELARAAWQRGGAGADCWLSELVWRDFYHMILWHHPHVVDACFRREYDALVWDDAPQLLADWCDGRTGYPLVDAGMRQLNQIGYMHNRLRMVTASFLTKDLGIDWRRGERYFARQLNDYDLAANNGGWQWAASTGCDAQPYFRIFNPVTQSEKFDPEGGFIKRYVPELAGVDGRAIHAPWRMSREQQDAAGVVIGRDYPPPIVDHAAARARTLARFSRVRSV